MNRKNKLANPKATLSAGIFKDKQYSKEPLDWPFLLSAVAFSLLTQGCITVHKEVVPSSSRTPIHPLVTSAIAENEEPLANGDTETIATAGATVALFRMIDLRKSADQ
jgi:hypothetical protein